MRFAQTSHVTHIIQSPQEPATTAQLMLTPCQHYMGCIQNIFWHALAGGLALGAAILGAIAYVCLLLAHPHKITYKCNQSLQESY